MLQRPDFDSKDIDPNLHQRMAKAVDDDDGRSRGTPMHVCTGMYCADAGLNWFVLVCTRLS